MERGKVLRAAGVSREEELVRVEKEKKIDKRAKRRYITQNLNKRIVHK